jgi:hypothetical protein
MKPSIYISVLVFVVLATALFLRSDSLGSTEIPTLTENTPSDVLIPVVHAATISLKKDPILTPTTSTTRQFVKTLSKSEEVTRTISSAGSEWTPDLYGIATKEIVKDVRWSEIIKETNLFPTDIVRIPAGVTLTYDVSSVAPVEAIVVRGSLIFDPSVSTKLYVGTIFVSQEGKLSIAPVKGKTAEIVFKGELSRDRDPAELLLGLVAVGGNVTIKGEEKPVPFTKVIGKKGENVITANASAWSVGDELFLSASGPVDADPTYWWFNARDISRRKPFPQEWETARVKSISENSITLDKELQYDHSGYVANLSRTVTIRSENPNPLKSRGHVMFTGNTSISVKNVRFRDLGRTTVAPIDNTALHEMEIHHGANEEGRYALHIHHLFTAFALSGNVIDGSLITRSFPGGSGERAIYGSPKWGIVNHDSSGSIANNIVIGAAGAGIIGEDGTETGVVERNLVVGTGGGSGDNDDERFGSSKGEDMGHGGFGYWFRGPFLNVRDNIALGHFNQSAYLYFVHPDFVPSRLSSQPWIPADLRGKSRGDLVSIESVREFKNNIASGFFGNTAFAAFYSQAPMTLENSFFEVLGKGNTNGILLRHSKSLHLSNSTLIGTSEGKALVSSESGQITESGNTISGFVK